MFDEFDAAQEERMWPTVESEPADGFDGYGMDDCEPDNPFGEVSEDKCRKEDIGEECRQCDECGAPILLGDWAVWSENGDGWCGWKCYQAAVKRIEEQERMERNREAMEAFGQ